MQMLFESQKAKFCVVILNSKNKKELFAVDIEFRKKYFKK